ncbi:MAG: hypothetical protein FWF08_04785, partial [Oscillospiraceae bacterium]|nr:hypothetical protein [Oscillospiraceae bacterium]
FKYEQEPNNPQSPEPDDEMPVPIDRRKKDWSAWVQNPYTDGYEKNDEVDETWEFNGHDYLFGYWLGRMYGYIGEDE